MCPASRCAAEGEVDSMAVSGAAAVIAAEEVAVVMAMEEAATGMCNCCVFVSRWKLKSYDGQH